MLLKTELNRMFSLDSQRC